MPGGRRAAWRLSSAGALDAAGIVDPLLRNDFETCRRLNAAQGKTYYRSTWLLPAQRRPWVWALYGFARHCDELIDGPRPDPERLVAWTTRLQDTLVRAEPGWDPVSRALMETHRRLTLPVDEIHSFIESMRRDISVTRYPTYDDLQQYMAGSACAIGSLMLPVLVMDDGPVAPATIAQARTLGEAFQLTNFLRDVGEDLDRGRIYLPQEDLDRFGVAESDLRAMRAGAPVMDGWRRLMEHEISRAHSLYQAAAPGIDALDPSVQPGIRCAFTLYGEILDAIRTIDYAVLIRRARVPRRRQAAVVTASLIRRG